MGDYLFNYIFWWFFVFSRIRIKNTLNSLIYNLNLTNTLPMSKNLFVPMFQNKSLTGRFMSLFIRFWWVGFGTFFSCLLVLPSLFANIFFILLPILPFLMFIILVLNNL